MSSRAAAASPAATPGDRTIDRATTASPDGPRAATSTPSSPTAHHARLKLTPRAAVLVFSMFIVAIIAIAPARAYLEQRDRLDDLRRQTAEVAESNEELRDRITDLNHPRTLERMARECLGMVMPGETAFVVIPRGEAPTPADCG